MSELTYTPVLVRGDFEDVKNVVMYGKPEKNYELAKQQVENEEKFIENKNAKKGIMVMRRTIIALAILFAVIACNAQTNIPATASWQADIDAVQYHIFVWEGNDAGTNPLVEDSSYAYISSLGLLQFTTTDLQVVFQTQVNGNYIQAAGFNENGAGLTAGATLSNLVLKPNEPTKMQILNLEL